MSRTAVVTIASGRHEHLRRQQIGLAESSRPSDVRVVVALGDRGIRHVVGPSGHVVEVEVDGNQLPLAHARNVGAAHALEQGAELLIFLDVDCIPDPLLITRYVDAAAQLNGRPALLCGPVTYLPPPGTAGYPRDLTPLRDPHPARPMPGGADLVVDDRVDLFWSLSFAVTRATWQRIGGFDSAYSGYGAEDTDFGFRARARAVRMAWVGGAHAYHQHHSISDPPIEHLDDILVNAAVFHAKWGQWPMLGWLRDFEKLGLVAYDDRLGTWVRQSSDSVSRVSSGAFSRVAIPPSRP